MEVIQLSLFGKMFPERSVQTVEKTSAPCWKNLPAWKNQTLQFLDLRGGQMEQGRSNRRERMELGLATARRSILGSAPEKKTYRSCRGAKACRGILTRASRRGKKLQELLETALLEMIEWWASRGGKPTP